MYKRDVSMAVIARISRYYRILTELTRGEVTRISSKELAELMGLTASQIRQDLNCFGGFGQQGYGYNVEHLQRELASILNLDKKHKAIIIGTGNLGHALINNFNFGQSGIEVIAAFDANPAVVGTMISSLRVLHIDTLEEFLKSSKADIAVFTLPKNCAADMAVRLCAAGIRGIWNFTSADLSLPEVTVPVENVHFSVSLMTLSYRLDQTE